MYCTIVISILAVEESGFRIESFEDLTTKYTDLRIYAEGIGEYLILSSEHGEKLKSRIDVINVNPPEVYDFVPKMYENIFGFNKIVNLKYELLRIEVISQNAAI